MKVREALAGAALRLAAGSGTPRLDAELLMAYAMGIDREAVLLSGLDRISPDVFEPLVRRREAGEPIAYIVGRRAFWTIDLHVGPGVLVPRPDSETLIEAAVAHFSHEGPRTILDLGTGSGALLLAALDQWPDARGLGIDISQDALAIARGNAERLGFGMRAEFRQGDWGAAIREPFDLILCNPPYVEDRAVLPRDVADWEPGGALFAGADGLVEYRRLAPQIGGLLRGTGLACVEIGAGQATAVTELFEAQGLKVGSRSDFGGHVRCLIVNH